MLARVVSAVSGGDATNQLEQLLWERVVARGVAPRAAAGWSSRQATGERAFVATGSAAVFDLASVTKVAFALTCALLHEEQQLDLEAPLHTYLPELAGTHGGGSTLESLLSHRAGLAPHRRLYAPAFAGLPWVRREALHLAATSRSGTRGPLYSDLGYILAGAALERALAVPLDHIVHRVLLGPFRLELGSSRAWRGRGGFIEFVPTEVQPARGGLLRGVVHDDNAWALAGLGLAGHAGLFGSLRGVLDLGRLLVDRSAERSAVGAAIRRVVGRRPGGSLCMGVDRVSGPQTFAGTGAGPETFGHLGFTGTSLWCDPDTGVVTALLTNRVYPRRNRRPDEPSIGDARRELHGALWSRAGLNAGVGQVV